MWLIFFPGPVILPIWAGHNTGCESKSYLWSFNGLSALTFCIWPCRRGNTAMQNLMWAGHQEPWSRQTVFFSDVVAGPSVPKSGNHQQRLFWDKTSQAAVIADLSKMPLRSCHGYHRFTSKSVGVGNDDLECICRHRQKTFVFIMIDPKMLELSIYEGIPHPGFVWSWSGMKDASNALRWCVGEMERRYKLMSALGVP